MSGRRATHAGAWTRAEAKALEKLSDPWRVQQFLDAIPYSADTFYRCPRRVLGDRKAHCFDGALFAAAALRRLGFPPLVLDMRAVRDDDHVIAVFRRDGHFGAVAKSNFVGLRYREPIHRTLRELVLSYFEDFYNDLAEKTLRSYSPTLDLQRFDHLDWERNDDAAETIAAALDRIRHFPLLTRAQERCLSKLDGRSYEAGMLGLDRAGLYKVTD
ncbi:MAG TPA: hypothetical protein VLW17_14645 [Thermoanaerobaculaceae bacterium]|nr:hypothetical protein [Thermoanaerobaculaceae bacterium]